MKSVEYYRDKDGFEKDFANQLKKLRIDRGLSIKQLSDLSGVKEKVIEAYENHESKHFHFTTVVAKILNGVGLEIEFVEQGNGK